MRAIVPRADAGRAVPPLVGASEGETDVVIYGVALLSFCMLAGMFVGDLIGLTLGVDANVGGVGVAMLLLLALSNLSARDLRPGPITHTGIGFWSAMYIPIVVAMAARQNVLGALSSGWMAIIAGIAAVAASFAILPFLARFGQSQEDTHDS